MSVNASAKAVDVVFNRGLRQDLNPQTAPPGVLTTADNVEFDQLGRLVRRDGFASVGTTTLSKGQSFGGEKARRFAQAPTGEKLLFGDYSVYMSTQNKLTTATCGLGGGSGQFPSCTANLADVKSIASENSGLLTYCDAVGIGTYIVYLYYQASSAAGVAGNVFADVEDTTTGTRVMARELLGTTAGNYPPRVVQSAGSSVAVALWEDTTGTAIKFSLLDLSVTPLAWGAKTSLVTDTGPAVFDADSCTVGWVIAYLSTTGTKVFINSYTSTGSPQASTGWLANGGTTTWAPTALAVAGDSSAYAGSLVHVAGYDPATQFVEANTLSSSLVHSAYGRVNPGLGATKHARHMTLGRVLTGQTFLAFTGYTATASIATNPRGSLLLYTLVDAGTLTSIQSISAYSLASRFFVDTPARLSSAYLVARYDDPSGAQNHFVLLDMGTAGATDRFKRPAFHFASGRVPLKADNARTGLGGMASLAGKQAGLFQYSNVVNIGASQISGNQLQAWTVQSLGTQRFLSTQCQRETVFGGATPMAFDGQKIAELSFFAFPVLKSGNITPANTGGVMAQGIYQYRAVYEWADAQGNRHQSPASPAVSVDMSAAGFAANTNSVAFSMTNMQLTRKQEADNALSSPVNVIFYRSLVGQGIFYRLPNGGANHVTSSTAITYTDTLADASISGNEPLYTKNGGQGLLDSTAPPPTLALTTHAGRLWGVDCENPERIWATRVLQAGSAPAYSPALQVIIPGAGRINGIGGQDGKLYALATNGVYLASYGDGPDDTGGGSFPSPELITTNANCSDPRGVLVGQDGIYFVGTDQWGTGIFQIRRGDGGALSIGKRVRNELAATPVCRGIVDRRSKERTEFLFVDSDTAPTKAAILYYHHDYQDEDGVGQWTVARVSNGIALEALGTWDDVSVIADESSTIGLQTVGTVADFGGANPVVTITTADIRPAGLVGFAQISGITLLGTRVSADPIAVSVSYDSGFSFADTTQFAATSESVGQPVLRRYDTPTGKMLDTGGPIRVKLSDPTLGGSNPGSTFFHGISIEVAGLGGNARLPDTKRA